MPLTVALGCTAKLTRRGGGISVGARASPVLSALVLYSGLELLLAVGSLPVRWLVGALAVLLSVPWLLFNKMSLEDIRGAETALT